MLKDFRTSAMIDLKNNLKNALELVQNSLNVRAELISYKSRGDLESQIIDSHTDPEHYYFFKFMDKAVSIVLDTVHVDNDGLHRKRSDEPCYHVKCYGWKSAIAKSRIYNLPYSYENNYYGNFLGLDEAISMFKKFCAEMLNVLGCDSQFVLEGLF